MLDITENKSSMELKRDLQTLQESIPYAEIERLRREILETENREYVGRFFKSTNRPDEIRFYKVLPNNDNEQWYLRGIGICLTDVILPEHLTEISEREFKDKLIELESLLAAARSKVREK